MKHLGCNCKSHKNFAFHANPSDGYEKRVTSAFNKIILDAKLSTLEKVSSRSRCLNQKGILVFQVRNYISLSRNENSGHILDEFWR